MLEVERFCCGDFSTNSYVVFNPSTGKAIIVDTPSGCEVVKEFIKEKRLNLLYVVFTHGHIDHIEGIEDFDVPFYIHFKERELLLNPSLNLSALFSSSFILRKEPYLVRDNDKLFLDNYPIDVLHTPGHTPGSLSLRIGDYLFCGDTLFFDSIGRTDFPLSSYEMLIRSIKEKILTLEGRTVIFPGHGPATSVERERKFNPFLGD